MGAHRATGRRGSSSRGPRTESGASKETVLGKGCRQQQVRAPAAGPRKARRQENGLPERAAREAQKEERNSAVWKQHLNDLSGRARAAGHGRSN